MWRIKSESESVDLEDRNTITCAPSSRHRFTVSVRSCISPSHQFVVDTLVFDQLQMKFAHVLLCFFKISHWGSSTLSAERLGHLSRPDPNEVQRKPSFCVRKLVLHPAFKPSRHCPLCLHRPEQQQHPAGRKGAGHQPELELRWWGPGGGQHLHREVQGLKEAVAALQARRARPLAEAAAAGG